MNQLQGAARPNAPPGCARTLTKSGELLHFGPRGAGIFGSANCFGAAPENQSRKMYGLHYIGPCIGAHNMPLLVGSKRFRKTSMGFT